MRFQFLSRDLRTEDAILRLNFLNFHYSIVYSKFCVGGSVGGPRDPLIQIGSRFSKFCCSWSGPVRDFEIFRVPGPVPGFQNQSMSAQDF